MADDQNTLLSQEYLELQRSIEAYESRSLTIKAWSVTFSFAAIGVAYGNDKPVLLLVAAGSACAFWLIDAVWKFHQRAFYPRVEAIEAHFAGEGTTAPFQTGRAWQEGARFTRKSIAVRVGIALIPSTALPHAVAVIAGIILYCSPDLAPA